MAASPTQLSLEWLVVVFVLAPSTARAQVPCPSAADIPQLAISDIRDPALPVIDRWQIMLEDVPLSDAQLAELAHDDSLIARTREEIGKRGTRVYIGMLAAAVGTAISCVGWTLYGRDDDDVPQALTLGMGLGGLILGGGGVLWVTDAIQRPLEPHLAPTPRHRLSREEARRLVALVNQRIFASVCEAADRAEDTREPQRLPQR